MNKLNSTGKLVISAVVLVVAVILVMVYGGGKAGNSQPTGGYQNPTSTASAPSSHASSGAGKAPIKRPSSGTDIDSRSPVPIITLITPVPGVTWTIATQNTVSWTQEAGVSGQIELLDASTKKLTGVILNQVGPHQIAYEWNTRDVYVSRTSPAKTTVLPGRYVVKISFDGNNVPPITSQPITLSN